MLERFVVIHSDFVHILRLGNAWIVEGHLRLRPRRASLVVGQRPHRPGTEDGAGASAPTLLTTGPLLLLAVRHELEPVPRLLGVASLAARLRLLFPPHAFGPVHGGPAARERDVVVVHEQAARIREDVPPPTPRDKRRRNRGRAGGRAARGDEDSGSSAELGFWVGRAPRRRASPRGVELRWGASWGNGWERAGWRFTEREGSSRFGRAPLAFIGADGKETSASRRDDGVRCPPPLPAQGRGDAATRDEWPCSCAGGPKHRDLDRDGDSSSAQQISFSFIALDNPVMSKSITRFLDLDAQMPDPRRSCWLRDKQTNKAENVHQVQY